MMIVPTGRDESGTSSSADSASGGCRMRKRWESKTGNSTIGSHMMILPTGRDESGTSSSADSASVRGVTPRNGRALDNIRVGWGTPWAHRDEIPLLVHKPRPLAVRPEELRAIRRAFWARPSVNDSVRRTDGPRCMPADADTRDSRPSAGPGSQESSWVGGPTERRGWLIGSPPTGATPRQRPRGADLIPRPEAVVLGCLILIH